MRRDFLMLLAISAAFLTACDNADDPNAPAGLANTPAAPKPPPRLTPSEEAPKSLPQLTTTLAFPNLRFHRPVAMASPADGGNLLFVVEQHMGKVYSFTNEKESIDQHLFLELPAAMSKHNEEGLLGLAFHPKYKENGKFYVYYSANDKKTGGPERRSVVSQFKVSPDDPRLADPKSEERIWIGPNDPFSNHNGGCITFGPDGFLYIALGDGGQGDDALNTGQNPTDFFASILRIDVDHPSGDKPYGIPADNPKSRGGAYGKWAPEVYAIGLRNVWKFSFDRKTGDLWAGDVGQNLWEMIHVVKNGGNYGWSVREGNHPFLPQLRRKADPAAPISPPIFEYPHAPTSDRKDDGKSVTGGYVYRGKALPELQGAYVFGDFDTGRIWGLRESGGKVTTVAELVDLTKTPKIHIAGFGEDAAGELYILAFDDMVYQLVPAK